MRKRTIKFKSYPGLYKKEKKGIKPNTTRNNLDWNIERWREYDAATHIIIENSATGATFERKITDKSLFDELSIISWKHKK